MGEYYLSQKVGQLEMRKEAKKRIWQLILVKVSLFVILFAAIHLALNHYIHRNDIIIDLGEEQFESLMEDLLLQSIVGA